MSTELESRLAVLEATLGASDTKQSVLQHFQSIVSRLHDLQDRTLTEFFDKYGLLEPLLVGLEAPSAMPAREREALVVSAADDVLSTAAQLESFASLAPLLDRVDANKNLFREATAPQLADAELRAAQVARRAAHLHARLLSLLDANFEMIQHASRAHVKLDAQLSACELEVALHGQPENS